MRQKPTKEKQFFLYGGTVFCLNDIVKFPEKIHSYDIHTINIYRKERTYMAFVHLHVHTAFSLLDACNKINNYVKKVKELGMTAAAITDHGVMYGVIDFYKTCKKEGIKPIIGCEVYVAPGSRFDKKKNESGDAYYHLILIAENNKGYENLSKIVSRSFTEGFYYKPRVDMELLEQFHEGIIATSACLAGEVARNITRGNIEVSEEAALKLQNCFGKGNFFLELQDHGYREQAVVNRELVKMSKKLNIPLIATNDVHYTEAGDAEAHDILLCVQTKKKLSDEDRMRYPGGQFYVKSEEEMRALFPYAQEAIDNTQKIADRCNVEIEFGVTKLPHFEVPEGYDSWTYLNKLCEDGLKERYPEDDGTLHERMMFELNTIKQMGYVDYFLIVWDYINFSREHDIPVGPGRGSAAGSIVSYCLHITDIDPVKYNLLFERFLNPERVSMPDIDVDFCFERRKEVIDYVTEKYGKEKVVQIITFGTMAARGVLKDVGRVMGIPYSFVDELAKMVPKEPKITLQKALKANPEFNMRYENDAEAKRLIDMALKLEGLPRNPSVHAAGVVICSAPAEDLIPLATGSDGSVVTQFGMTTVEELGLLKMDFLGLKTLTVVKNAAEMAGISLNDINYNDPEVYKYISTGKTTGVFQLESGGMQGFMKELRPQNMEDLIAGISLYRPGPMDFIPQYISGKNNPSAVRYACPQMEPILKNTYGCLVYQEQVMRVVRDLGGYTLGRSDIVRRAMSKKKEDVMIKERKNFVYGNEEEGVPGCVSKGISAEVANGIYDTMMDFAKYAFNKSHAACYAFVAYQTAWLKYYYPKEYMAALITSVMDKPDKLTAYIFACREMNIALLPPDINLSLYGFLVSENGIRYGLTAVKGVGINVLKEIVKERRQNGRYTDLYEFIERNINAGTGINKKVLESMIFAGAFDSFGLTRRQMIMSYAQIVDTVTNEKRNNIAGQLSLFDMFEEERQEKFSYPNVGEYPWEEKLDFEKSVCGVYISGHPLDEYEQTIRKSVTKYAQQFAADEDGNVTEVRDGEPVVIGGQITESRTILTKKQETMAFITIEDISGTVEVVIFPKSYAKFAEILKEDSKVLIEGKVSAENSYAKVILFSAKALCKDSEVFGKKQNIKQNECTDILKKRRVYIRIKEDIDNELQYLSKYCSENPGGEYLIIYIEKDKKTFARGIALNKDTLQHLSARYGKDNVVVKAGAGV